MAPPTLGEQLRADGWKHGCVVAPEQHEAVRPHLRHGEEVVPAQIAPDEWLIVVSQTCDVVAFRDDAEPHVELLWARPHRGRPRAQFRELHSTRRLDFRPNRDALPDTVLTVHATADRYFVPRALLARARPSEERRLGDVAAKRLQAWFALRATRPAWPDSLVCRVKPVETRLEAALEALAEEIAEVRIAIAPNDQELDAGTPYRVGVFFVVPPEVFEASPDARQLVYERFVQFAAALGSCDGVVVDTDLSGVFSGDEFTWDDTRNSDLWDFAYLSPFE